MIDSTTTFLDLSVVVDDVRIACRHHEQQSPLDRPRLPQYPLHGPSRPAEHSVPFAYATAAGRRSRQLTGCAWIRAARPRAGYRKGSRAATTPTSPATPHASAPGQNQPRHHVTDARATVKPGLEPTRGSHLPFAIGGRPEIEGAHLLASEWTTPAVGQEPRRRHTLVRR
jgi:hypothetical protein